MAISTRTSLRIRVRIVAWAAALAVALLLAPVASQATAGDKGYVGASYAGAGTAPTGQKPESKLWWNDGRWWACMFDVGSSTWHVFYLDRSTSPETWVDTGTIIDTRASSRADSLWDGSHLYLASHAIASSNTAAASGRPARLYRFSYSSTTKRYTLDSGFPATISDYSNEAMTLDKDSTGRLWATWAQGQTVYVNASGTSDSSWGVPFALPVSNANNLDPDDISTLVSFADKIGVMWSNQTDSKVYFSVHKSSDPLTTWSASQAVTIPGPKQADDHLNIKSLQSDLNGRVFAVIKTSLDETSQGRASPQIVVLSRDRLTGGWDRATFGTVGDCHTRPVLMLDSTNSLLHVFATAPDSGCPYSGSAGTIFEKTSPLDNLSFASGRGTAVMRDAASPNLNNVSGSKQTVNATTGLVMLASNDTTKRYWFSDSALGSPGADFSAAPASGTAPLDVQFTDSSTGTPTSWSWDFGDGGHGNTANPSHTYTSAGTYTVSLTATNGSGSDTVTKTGMVRVSSVPSSGQVTSGASTSAFSTAATTAVPLPRPSGLASGDLVVAQITADLTPSIATVPSGWAAVPGVSAASIGSGARVFTYYHVVGSAPEPSSWTWQLSTARKWGGGVSAYRGVNTASPFAVTAVTKVDSSYSASTLTLSGITTSQNGAMLIGGLGCDCSLLSPTPPNGWTKPWQAGGGQFSALGYAAQPVAGSTGPVTWTLGATRGVAGWLSALTPAS